VVNEINIEPGVIIVLYTDGLVHAGDRRGQRMDACTIIESMLEEQDPSPQSISDELLAHAVSLDDGRPADDISVVTIKVTSRTGDQARRMSVRLPIE
jgi:serine phosphatase RsbU (regulator of sigma subunit)